MKRFILVLGLAISIALMMFMVSCGDEEKTTQTTASSVEAEKVTVNFDAMGGNFKEGSLDRLMVEEGKTLSENRLPQVESAEGYDFLYWAYDKAGKTRWYPDEPFYRDDTLYAIWDDHMALVTFDPNGGDITDGNDTEKVAEGEHLKWYKLPDVERKGYELVGWSYRKDDLALEYGYSGSTIEDDVTLYAIWALETVKVDFYIIWGEFVSGDAYVTVAVPRGGKLDPSKLPEIIVNRGRRFVCWAYDSDGIEVWNEDDIFTFRETLWAVTEPIQ